MKKISLRANVARIEDSIIIISGPCLAISGIVAGVDLVTGGNLLKSMGWLTLAWAITLLLTLDFQVLTLGVRAHRVYSSSKSANRKVIEVAIAVLIAAAISFVSIQMQSIIARVNAESITIDLAAAQLGINTVWLIWERSTLVLVLIFMAGWLREHDSVIVETPAPVQTPVHAEAAEAVQELVATVRELTFTVTQISRELPAIRIEEVSVHPALTERKQEVDKQAVIESTNPTLERVRSYLAVNPNASTREVAQAMGFSATTASKWMKRAKEE